jgi:DNA-binding transcriptional LysR family regulator
MDIRQLRTFSCVAELGSLSKASDTLRVAQPALSRQIKLLEHELRADLFTRNGRGMVLTDAGRLLLARTAGIVRQIDQVRDEIQSAGGPPSGRVVLGLVPTVSCVISARLARRTVDKYPGISLCIVESYSGHLMEWLHRGEMDLALIYGPSSDLHLTVQSLGRDPIVAVGPRGSGLSQKKQVDIGWLLKQTLVLPSHSHGLRAADRAGGGEEENQARRQTGGGFVSGAYKSGRGRVGVHAVAAFLGAPRSSLRPAGNGGDIKTVADARTDPCVSHRPSRLGCDCAGERTSSQRTCRLPRRGPLGHQARLSRCEGLADWLSTIWSSPAFSSGYSSHAAIV